MSSLQIGRLLLGPPAQWYEGVGDPVAALGGAVVPAQRTASQTQATIATWAADGQTDTPAARLVLRRQLRSLLNNSPLKFQAFLYVLYSDDPEQNGWYVPDQGSLQDFSGSSGLATGLWNLSGQNWDLIGRRRTHREARQIWMKDLRTGLYQRDQLGWIYSTDFSSLPLLQLTMLAPGASSVQASYTLQAAVTTALPTGRDGGTCLIASGLSDLTVLSYERPEAQMNVGDVVVYDRMGMINAPTTGPDPAWSEVYGPDWPWNWLTVGQPNDTPVLDNGLVRVRYDASVGLPGFRVDVWNGSAYVEQGKMCFRRAGDSVAYDDTWVAGSLVEWTPERAVMLCVLSASGDLYSRERVYITVQRGELGVTFECYPSVKSTQAQADIRMIWTPALNAGVPDLNESIAKIDSQGSGSWTPGAAGSAVLAATAGTGAGAGNSGRFPGSLTTLGNANFTTSENWAAILRYPTTYNTISPYQTTLTLQQAANAYLQYQGADASCYGTATDAQWVLSQNTAGYLQVGVSFGATQAQQVMEAESMTLGSGTSSTADGSASGGSAATSTRTADAIHVSQATWPNGLSASYRVFARVKTSASTLNIYAKTGATTGTTVTTTSGTYVWVDLGEIVANGTTLEIHCWATAAATVSVDRIEAVLTQDRVRTSAIFSGSRDAGQSALADSRQLAAVTARQ